MDNPAINHRSLYRLPWTLPDNAISWLEPTAMCNLACDGCYRQNEKNSHKTMEQINHELDVFQSKRNSDCISIAGGDPLLHPQIKDIIANIKARGFKPILNTNGKALNPSFLKELKEAGVFGFTFHIDSKQGRSGEWKGKNEIELNKLRYHYARMVADGGGMSCSFNSTVYEDTLQYVPELVKWAEENIDIVHTMVFICFRYVVPAMPFEWYAGGKKVNWQNISYHSDTDRKIDILSTDVLQKVRKRFPEFTPAAYLNGIEKVDSLKWMLTERIGRKGKIYGYLGPKFLELIMITNHFFKGSYLSYASPKLTSKGRASMLFLWPFDKGLRKAAVNYIKNPLRIFTKAHMQTIMFIQPVDFMEDGRQNMCDGCPDITVWNDDIVWSCRLEEQKQFGTFLRSVKNEVE